MFKFEYNISNKYPQNFSVNWLFWEEFILYSFSWLTRNVAAFESSAKACFFNQLRPKNRKPPQKLEDFHTIYCTVPARRDCMERSKDLTVYVDDQFSLMKKK